MPRGVICRQLTTTTPQSVTIFYRSSSIGESWIDYSMNQRYPRGGWGQKRGAGGEKEELVCSTAIFLVITSPIPNHAHPNVSTRSTGVNSSGARMEMLSKTTHGPVFDLYDVRNNYNKLHNTKCPIVIYGWRLYQHLFLPIIEMTKGGLGLNHSGREGKTHH